MEQNNQTIQTEVNNMGGQSAQNMPKPDNNLALAIFTTVCCCLPLGIYAIVKASSVNSLYLTGNYEAAVSAAAEAKKWSVWGIVIGAIINIAYFGLYMFGALASLS